MGYERTTRKVQKEETYVSAAWCDRCGKQCQVEYETQARDAAMVRMSGWYAGYIDLETVEWLLCSECCIWLEGQLGAGKRGDTIWR